MTFVLYKASYDWKYCFLFFFFLKKKGAHNSIMYDCERITFVIFKDRRLTKMTMKTFYWKQYNTSRHSKLEAVYILLPLSIYFQEILSKRKEITFTETAKYICHQEKQFWQCNNYSLLHGFLSEILIALCNFFYPFKIFHTVWAGYRFHSELTYLL